MDKKYIWIAKGFVVSSKQKIPISEFLNKSDNILLDVISPIVRNLQQRGILKKWYSGRSQPRPKIPYWRARLYLEIAEKKKRESSRYNHSKCKRY